MEYNQQIIDSAVAYVNSIQRYESAPINQYHDEARQLAHNEFLWQLQLAGYKVNSASFDERSEATQLAYKIVRWLRW